MLPDLLRSRQHELLEPLRLPRQRQGQPERDDGLRDHDRNRRPAAPPSRSTSSTRTASVGTSAAMGNSVSFNNANSGATSCSATPSRGWWIEHKDVGRLTVGRFESAGVVADHRPRWHLHGRLLELHPGERQLLRARSAGSVLQHDLGHVASAIRLPTKAVPSSCATQPDLAWASSSLARSPSAATTGARCCATPASSTACASRPASATRGSGTANTGVTLDPASPLFVGPQPDIECLGRCPVGHARADRSVRPGPLHGG